MAGVGHTPTRSGHTLTRVSHTPTRDRHTPSVSTTLTCVSNTHKYVPRPPVGQDLFFLTGLMVAVSTQLNILDTKSAAVATFVVAGSLLAQVQRESSLLTTCWSEST